VKDGVVVPCSLSGGFYSNTTTFKSLPTIKQTEIAAIGNCTMSRLGVMFIGLQVKKKARRKEKKTLSSLLIFICVKYHSHNNYM
jgi:hypothetical protein